MLDIDTRTGSGNSGNQSEEKSLRVDITLVQALEKMEPVEEITLRVCIAIGTSSGTWKETALRPGMYHWVRLGQLERWTHRKKMDGRSHKTKDVIDVEEGWIDFQTQCYLFH